MECKWWIGRTVCRRCSTAVRTYFKRRLIQLRVLLRHSSLRHGVRGCRLVYQPHKSNSALTAVTESPDYKQRVQSIKDLVRQLPVCNHDTMQTLFKHLRKVIEYSEENRMTTQSVAIVYGPTLLRPEQETWNIAVYMVYQNQIVELILLEYENIFGR
ncbi:rho GTPase-activating protein 12-like [Trematomus bernacchii]|uniref:rho GTPase-activating protein 12-like n=1 Tax=Trematomus bernacchii TaxID=40690 RepID=UPI00146BD566|nr:rho GTPase-activating protein 12-like [Trematomus bernacchii]